jgi:hypothetical protein
LKPLSFILLHWLLEAVLYELNQCSPLILAFALGLVNGEQEQETEREERVSPISLPANLHQADCILLWEVPSLCYSSNSSFFLAPLRIKVGVCLLVLFLHNTLWFYELLVYIYQETLLNTPQIIEFKCLSHSSILTNITDKEK